ncbi:prophage PSPPH06 tail sheath protein [Pseudomonas syringae pv. actinidiae ICMP 19070]|nr:prophage PSPPH06 tail sheath protein [Pseudomonas syringae pv. actinidiae ICMP 19070]
MLSQLDAARLSVPQTYPDYPGTYWGDGNMLDTPGSDFQVIENLRVVDKAARRVRALLIRYVGDRTLNSSANSMATTTSKLMAPLRAMAKSTKFAGQVFPGDIEQPKDGDIVLTWTSKTSVVAYLKLRPLNCPKDLTANIALDLSVTDSE